jgi:hypothetical protein
MTPGIGKQARYWAVLLALLAGASCQATDMSRENPAVPGMDTEFRHYDADHDGYLSLPEFEAKGLDNLAFRAADLDGDNRLDPAEFDQYIQAKAADRAKPD